MTKETDTIEEYKELEVVNIRLVKEPSIISEKPISNAKADNQRQLKCCRYMEDRQK